MKTLLKSNMSVVLLFVLISYVSSCNGNNIHHLRKRSSNSNQSAIIGGSIVDIHDFPALAHLDIELTKQNGECTASIIHIRIVLTSAACLQGAVITISITVGSIYRGGGPRYNGDKFHIHPNYKPQKPDYAIGLVRSEVEITFTDKIKAIKMVQYKEELLAGTEVNVLGWGKLGEKSVTVNLLRAVRLTVIFNGVCQVAYRDRYILPERMFCAVEEGKGVCTGDAGGPAINKGGIQVGLVASGAGCGRVGDPAIFTKIAPYRLWMNATIHKLITH